MIRTSRGLQVGLTVLELLRNDESLDDYRIHVGAFTNCREVGLTFYTYYGAEFYTWCVYEHRNSDEIIVNGKDGLVSCSGDLPYKGDSSGDYLAAFQYGEYDKAAKFLAEEIKNFVSATKIKHETRDHLIEQSK